MTDGTGPRNDGRRGISRRQLLAGGASAGGAIAVGTALTRVAGAASSPQTYRLSALTDAEAAVLGAMADRIFPPDDGTPGAQQLGFVPYLDGQLAGAWGAGQGLYRHGPFHEAQTSGHGYQLPLAPKALYKDIAGKIDAYAQRHGGQGFASLSHDQQETIMKAMEAGKVDLGYAHSENGYTSTTFFSEFQQRVNEALFADPMYGGNKDLGGWKWIGYPGDPMAYGDGYWSIISHQDDPYEVAPVGLTEGHTGGLPAASRGVGS